MPEEDERQVLLHAETAPDGSGPKVWLRMTADGTLAVEGQNLVEEA